MLAALGVQAQRSVLSVRESIVETRISHEATW